MDKARAAALAATEQAACHRPRATRSHSRGLPIEPLSLGAGGAERLGTYWTTGADLMAEQQEQRLRQQRQQKQSHSQQQQSQSQSQSQSQQAQPPTTTPVNTPFKHHWGNVKYITFPPPIMCLNFTLLVVDETQKIEAEGVSHALAQCVKLQARRRLCVSGTPLGNSRISDLHSLCQFLRIAPYDSVEDKWCWNRVFGEKSIVQNEAVRHRWLADIFQDMTLRRTKLSVAHQLGDYLAWPLNLTLSPNSKP